VEVGGNSNKNMVNDMSKLFFVVAVFLTFPNFARATNYFVGSGGDYVNFAEFHSEIQTNPGDVVDGMGNTFFEEIIVNGDGLQDNPIVYRNFKVVGATLLDEWIGPDVNGEYFIDTPRAVDGAYKVEILIKDGVIVNRAPDNFFGSLSPGYWTLDVENRKIYYKPDSGMEHLFEAGNGDLIQINGHDNIKISEVTLYGGANGVKSSTYASENVASGLQIVDSEFYNFYGHGVQLYSSDKTEVRDSKFSYCQKGGVKLGGINVGWDRTGDNAIISGNNFYRNGWAHVDYDSEEHVIDVMTYSTSPLIINNVISENGYLGGQTYTETLTAGTCVSVDAVDDFVISNNYFYDNYNGSIVFGPDEYYAGTVGVINNNVFKHNGLAQVDSGSVSNKLRIISSKNNIGSTQNLNVSILHNTFYNNQGNVGNFNNGAANIFLAGNSGLDGLTVKNNLHFENANKADFRVYTENGTIGYVEDNNLYYRSENSDYLAIGGLMTTSLYPITNSFLSFAASTGANGDVNMDPLFASLDTLQLSANSPARDAADDGSDVGAFEYVGVQNPTPIYGLVNFISAITNWLGIGNETSDVNSDGVVNTRDLGVMMSNWSN
jgi:hypothetical protein